MSAPSPRRVFRPLVAAVAVLLAVVSAQLTGGTAAVAAPTPADVVTVYYDASGSAEFRDAVDQGAQAWNAAVRNVRLVPATDGGATVTVLADDGWPRTYPEGFGQGTVYMGREAVNEGFYPPRIAAHEFGHILGLDDNRNGRCDYLMSGHSSPVSCTNTTPHPTEAAQVDQNATGGWLVPARASYQGSYRF